jgi:hypothetical protein
MNMSFRLKAYMSILTAMNIYAFNLEDIYVHTHRYEILGYIAVSMNMSSRLKACMFILTAMNPRISYL